MGFFPEGEDGEKFRRDMRALGMASSFSTAAGIGIFCTAKFAMSAPGTGYAWLAGGILGFAASAGAIIELKNYYKDASNPPPPSSPKPPPPALKFGQPKL